MLKQVIGIVGDVKQEDLTEPAMATAYEYTQQHAWNSLSIIVRTAVPPTSLAQPAAAAVRAIDPEQPVDDIRTMDDVIDDSLTSQRFSAMLAFASVALALATGDLQCSLHRARPQPRIRIRTALGAGKATCSPGRRRRDDAGGHRLAAGMLAALGSGSCLKKWSSA
jgi:hypothetical protein